jgi:hypothetical protein
VKVLTAAIKDRPVLSDQSSSVGGWNVQDIADLPLGDVHAIHTARELVHEDDSHLDAEGYPKYLPLCLTDQVLDGFLHPHTK